MLKFQFLLYDTFFVVKTSKRPFPGALGSGSSIGFETSSPRIDERRILLELIWVQQVYLSQRIKNVRSPNTNMNEVHTIGF